MRHSKVKQSDLDKFVPVILFTQETENASGQRKFEKIGYMQALRSEPADPLTDTQAESICEKMLLVREYNDKLPF